MSCRLVGMDLAGAKADIILLQEVDVNCRRTHHVNVATEIAKKLEMNYVFGQEFQELTQGSKTSPAYHGQATLSRWPLSKPRIIRFRKQSDFWRPHWFLPEVSPFQERLGGRMALVSEVNFAGETIFTYNLHLESRGDDELRCAQLDETLSDAKRYTWDTPILLAGDFNIDASGDLRLAQSAALNFRMHSRTATGRRPLAHSGSMDGSSIGSLPMAALVSANLKCTVQFRLPTTIRFPSTW